MINEGWIWTYYDCSNACYLFGRFELPCIFMTLSNLIGALILFYGLFWIWSKFRTGGKK